MADFGRFPGQKKNQKKLENDQNENSVSLPWTKQAFLHILPPVDRQLPAPTRTRTRTRTRVAHAPPHRRLIPHPANGFISFRTNEADSLALCQSEISSILICINMR